jgi:hypothetical protein
MASRHKIRLKRQRKRLRARAQSCEERRLSIEKARPVIEYLEALFPKGASETDALIAGLRSNKR